MLYNVVEPPNPLFLKNAVLARAPARRAPWRPSRRLSGTVDIYNNAPVTVAPPQAVTNGRGQSTPRVVDPSYINAEWAVTQNTPTQIILTNKKDGGTVVYSASWERSGSKPETFSYTLTARKTGQTPPAIPDPGWTLYPVKQLPGGLSVQQSGGVVSFVSNAFNGMPAWSMNAPDYPETFEYQKKQLDQTQPDFINWRLTVRGIRSGIEKTIEYKEPSGGAPNFLTAYSGDILRALTDLGTLGQNEVLRALGQKDFADKVDQVYGGGTVAAVTAALTGGVLAPAAVATALESGAIAGTVTSSLATAKGASAEEVLGGALKTGAIAGATVGATQIVAEAIAPAAPTAPPAPTQGPVTLTPETAGWTELPPSLSLVQPPPVTAFLPVNPAEVISGAAASTLSPIEPHTASILTSTPQDAAGSTLLPPSLSVNPSNPLNFLNPPGADGSLLGSILSGGKDLLATAGAAYKTYETVQNALNPSAPAGGAAGGPLVFVGDPNAKTPVPPEAAKSALPWLAGGALLLLLYAHSG